MSTKAVAKPQETPELEKIVSILAKYGCGPVRFVGTSDALYERHLLFDSVVDLSVATTRDRFEALARSIRDILSQRWILTEKTYNERNPKRLYYLSMEFLIGRSLSNNVTNLMLEPLRAQFLQNKKLDWIDVLEQEPDPGLGNGGLGRLAACFIESAATLQLPAMGYGDAQIRDLEETIRRTPCDVVVVGTPIDLRRVLTIDKPAVRVRYELQDLSGDLYDVWDSSDL